MLQYEPMTEEQIDKLGLIEGRFRFRVIQADDVISKNSGLPQIELKIRVQDSDGNPRIIKCFLSTNGQFMLRRLRHFCRATNLMKEYEAKKMCAAVCLDAIGIVDLAIKKGQPMDNNPGRNFPDKTEVVDFIESDDSIKPEAKKDDFYSDEIPF